jgi:lysine 2,3-aminomutase
MGWLPGFATPRIVCDVPFVGKRWVHQVESYDMQRGISYWRKNYRTSIEGGDEAALSRDYVYYDPIDTLPEAGQDWWRSQSDLGPLDEVAAARAKSSRELAVTQAG